MWEAGAQVLEGRFRIVSSGNGERGEVYVAEQLSLGRRVTLRVFRPPLGERFDEEVRRLAAVEHPAVVRVIDSGQAEGVQFLVSELAEGARLSDQLKGEPLLPERAVELVTQIAEGMAALHAKGLAHGDLRPGTVLLVKSARGEQARLCDFGLVALSAAVPEGPRADAPGDLVALGALAYEALAGVAPERPIARPLAEAAPHLAEHPALCALVMAYLEPDPGSAAELAKKLATLPRPAEPTIFLETMQRPPPVPVKSPPPAALEAPPPLPQVPAPPAPAVAAVAPPAQRPLLASVMTMTMPVEAAPKVTAPEAASRAPARRWLPIAAGAAGLGALVVVLVSLSGNSVKREARKLLERRQPMQALEIIGKAQRKLTVPDPELVALKVAGLHLSDAHADETSLFKTLGGAPEAMDPLVLSGLVEDFSKKEDAGLRALLRGLPAKRLQAALEEFARQPLSARQWGALRYLDLEEAAGDLSLVEEYAASLESSDCGIRKAAAKRLGAMMDDTAEPALNRLRDAPREGVEKSCGQDEAQAAIQTLRKGR